MHLPDVSCTLVSRFDKNVMRYTHSITNGANKSMYKHVTHFALNVRRKASMALKLTLYGIDSHFHNCIRFLK